MKIKLLIYITLITLNLKILANQVIDPAYAPSTYKTSAGSSANLLDKSLTVQTTKNQFVIIIPSYNNEKWCIKNLESIFMQKYSNFRVIYINDCSADNTGNLVTDYLQKNNLLSKCTYIENKVRNGALQNFYNSIHSCDDEEIIVCVDGDDWLAHDEVLNILNNVYQDKKVLFTYGSYITSDRFLGGAAPYSKEVIQKKLFRNDDWKATHLKSFKAHIFKKIKKEDFMNQDKFFEMCSDVAFTIPILEMVSPNFKFIPDILYVYNNSNPLNDRKINIKKQQFIEKLIKQKQVYPSLETENV